MTKKVLALVLVTMLALGALAVNATAANTDEIDYHVGYTKVDINPYWSIWEAAGGSIPTDLDNYANDQNGNPIGSDHLMPIPMGGYGGNAYRLSRPELIDDNGSGVHAASKIYLTNNRYTQAFAKEMLGDGTAEYNAYAAGGFGQNDGDGLYGTCVVIRESANAEPLVYISVDFIGVQEAYCGNIKNHIIAAFREQGVKISANRILINATHTHGSIALNQSFTAGSTYNQKLFGNAATVPFLGSQLSGYLTAYRNHLYDTLAQAAVKALVEDATNHVTMEKSIVDVSEVTGYTLNGVRHKKAQITTNINGTEQTVDYVTGSSFNVDFTNNDGTAAKLISGVSESNDKMQVLAFTFDDPTVKPILMVNWRAHTTINNKMNSKAYNNLSADFVAPMRYQLEQWGYRPILSYGTSGNLGTADTPSTQNISTSSTATTMPATKYGNALAMAAAWAVDSEKTTVQTIYNDFLQQKKASITAAREEAEENAADERALEKGYIEQANKASMQSTKERMLKYAAEHAAKAEEYEAQAAAYLAQEQQMDAQFAAMLAAKPEPVVCTQGPILLESISHAVQPQVASDAGYEAALYHNALAVDEGGSAANDGGLKLEKSGYPFLVKAGTYTANGETFTVSADFVLASQYHASSLLNRHGTMNVKRFSLAAFTLGDQVAFVTMPFEASDRYSAEATLATANDYNDWDNLNNDSKWGVPFIVSLVNGTEGYLPNSLAYTYDRDLEAAYIASPDNTHPFVSGSYEAHNTTTAAGEGEKVVAALNTLLRGLATSQPKATQTKYCQACKETVQWQALDNDLAEDLGGMLGTDHYYLAEDYTDIYSSLRVSTETACLDLNGHTLYVNTATGSRAVVVYSTLNVQDSIGGGKLQGSGIAGNNGGTVLVESGGVFNLYSGTLTCTNLHTPSSGGVVFASSNGTFNMYGGTVTGGKASSFGGNVSAQHSGTTGGTFNMYGGEISGGTAASTTYANLMVSGYSTFRYAGGYIPTGAFMQGTMLLGSKVASQPSTQTATIAVRNNGTVTLDGVFTGKVKLNYENSNVYAKEPDSGDTIGAVTPGSWIDYVNDAKISATSTTKYEGVVNGTQLQLGTKPAVGYCEACQAGAVWMPFTIGAVNGHFAMTSNANNMDELTIPADGKLCLDLNGQTYTASGRAFTVNGTLNIIDTQNGGSLRGAVVNNANGGTVYVAKNGVVNQHGGELSCTAVENAAIKNGGVVYVENGGSYTLHDGTITGGTATGNGGNVYNDGTFLMKGGNITNGTAAAETGTHMGGNVYTSSSFTMAGGSISGGTATYGGNVQAQGGTAFFTMAGGTVTGGEGATNICTGQSGTANGLSTFRMEGGSVVGTVYVQGKAILTDTTAGDDPIDISIKEPHERLTIEGVYAGKINLTLKSDTTEYALGSKIGISDNANLYAAVITVKGFENYCVKVNDDALVISAPSGIVASVGEQFFDNISAAINAYSKSSEPVVLLEDASLGTLPKDVCVDLNGFDVLDVTTGDYKLNVCDRTTDDYDVSDGIYGTAPAGQNIYPANGYLAVAEFGKTSFHKYELEMSELVVKPSVQGISYKSIFRGDEKVKEQIKEFGVAMRAYNAPNATTIWADPEGKTHVALDSSEWRTGNNDNKLKSVYVEKIILDDLDATANQTRCDVPVYGRAYIQLNDGTMLFSNAKGFTMQQAVEHVDSWWDSLSDDNKTDLQNFFQTYEELMKNWNLPNINPKNNELTVIPE